MNINDLPEASLQINTQNIMKNNPISEGKCQIFKNDKGVAIKWIYYPKSKGSLSHEKVGTRCILQFGINDPDTCVIITEITKKSYKLKRDTNNTILC